MTAMPYSWATDKIQWKDQWYKLSCYNNEYDKAVIWRLQWQRLKMNIDPLRGLTIKKEKGMKNDNKDPFRGMLTASTTLRKDLLPCHGGCHTRLSHVHATTQWRSQKKTRNYAKGCEQEYDVKHHIDAVKQTVTQEQNFRKPLIILMVIITDDSINLMS